MTLEQRVKQLVKEHGGLRAAARATNINPGYLHRLASGVKRNPSEETLTRLGLEKTYKLKGA